jgi:maltose-binding protein MalE
MKLSRKSALLGTAAFALMATQAVAEQRTLKYYADFDPAPLAAFEAAIAEFEAANPDIDVVLQNFRSRRIQDRDPQLPVGRRTGSGQLVCRQPHGALRQCRSVHGYLGCLGPRTIWAKTLASAKGSMTIDGKQWGVPYTYYQWGIYYNKDAYKQAGAEVPTTWAEFIANCAQVQGSRHRLRDHRHQGAVARSRHLRLHEPAHQRLRFPHGSDRRQGSLDRRPRAGTPSPSGPSWSNRATSPPTMPRSTGRMPHRC